MALLPSKPAESSKALGAGLTFAVTVALFALSGNWLDAKLGTGPLLVVVLTLLGVVGGAIHVIHELAPGTLGFDKRPTAKTKSEAANPAASKGATEAPGHRPDPTDPTS
jgi:F0F1-type ATP synthase assembly protein I